MIMTIPPSPPETAPSPADHPGWPMGGGGGGALGAGQDSRGACENQPLSKSDGRASSREGLPSSTSLRAIDNGSHIGRANPSALCSLRGHALAFMTRAQLIASA